VSTLSKHNRLLGEAAAAAKAAREIAEKADTEGREMTADERQQFDAKFQEATAKKADADVAKKDAEVLAQAKDLADLVGDDATADLDAQGGDGGDTRRRAKSLGLQVVDSKEFKALMGQFPNGRVPEKSRVQSAPIGVKALITGGSDTSGGAFVVPEQTGIVEMLGRRTLAIRNVVSVRRTGSDAVEFVRQTGHTNNAAPVPEATSSAAIGDGTGGTATNVTGGVKPEGSWAFERDTAVVKTIAEWVPATKRALSDVSALEGLINDELEADLAEAEETQMVSGNGTGENLEGILTVSGTQGQAFDTDIFTTTRRAISKVRLNGRAIPNGIGLNPADVEVIDLARTNEGGANTGSFLGGGPFAMGPRTLWGLPIVESEAFPAGTGVVADFTKAVLWDREQASVTISDSHADFFTRNLVAILGEERVAFAVTRPSAFVVTDVAA
jgi:HK97 family phage major capsid protein